ncbi:MAG: FAD-dependent oxidoreductase [Acidobacteriota bacterium]|nr:FAD-dependent oxidoreductase [Acidobacteriota bacterium]
MGVIDQVANRRKDIVLVGGGHSHIQVLRNFATKPPPHSRLTLIVDTPMAVYSGMVPGLIAGHYRKEELEIDVKSLAEKAQSRVVVARAVSIDSQCQRIFMENQTSIRYDLASFNIGSTVLQSDIPGVREHAIATRPIGRFVHQIERIIEQAKMHNSPSPFQVVVVGGGIGGVEVAFTLQQRLQQEVSTLIQVMLLERGPHILDGYPESLIHRVHRKSEKRGLKICCKRRVVTVRHDQVELDDGECISCQAVLWVTGAACWPIFRESGLPTDLQGFVRVGSTLQVEGYDNLFAVGDCSTLVDYPQTPKAGVYAVRQGPLITNNIRAAVMGRPLRCYSPQTDFLALLNMGDGTALGTKWGRSAEGHWVMKLKNYIDQRFVRRFQSEGNFHRT